MKKVIIISIRPQHAANILNSQPTFKVGAKVYYRNPIDLCEGKVVKNLKDDVMVETEGKIITLKRTEILGDKN